MNRENDGRIPPSDRAAHTPPLKRETIVVTHERGRLSMLIALCSLAGVAVGFGLSSVAANYNRAMNARAPVVRAVDCAPDTAWLGVQITDARTRDGQPGARVERIFYGAPAERYGLQPGDIVLEYDGQLVRGADHLVRLVRHDSPADTIEVVVSRDGRRVPVRAVLADIPQRYCR